MEAKIRRIQALTALCRTLTAGLGKQACVVLGSANVTRGTWYRPVPHRKLVAMLRQSSNVVLVNEYHTSRICGMCGFRGDGHGSWLKPGPSGQHGVRRCPNHECVTSICHRDQNSARSIEGIHLHMERHGECRPDAWRMEEGCPWAG